MSLGRYTLLVVALAGGSLALLWAGFRGRWDSPTAWAALYGASVASANAVAAHFLVLWSSGRASTGAFLKAVLGGTALRMAVMLAALVAASLWLRLPTVPLVVSLLGYFTLFLALEMTMLAKGLGAGQRAR